MTRPTETAFIGDSAQFGLPGAGGEPLSVHAMNQLGAEDPRQLAAATRSVSDTSSLPPMSVGPDHTQPINLDDPQAPSGTYTVSGINITIGQPDDEGHHKLTWQLGGQTVVFDHEHGHYFMQENKSGHIGRRVVLTGTPELEPDGSVKYVEHGALLGDDPRTLQSNGDGLQRRLGPPGSEDHGGGMMFVPTGGIGRGRGRGSGGKGRH